ncbi:MAG: TadE/TadG family type IV pilus assembly protein [Xanthobacteraceae bacterium]
MDMMRIIENLSRTWRRLRSDRRGNVAIIFGLAILPIFGAVGAAVDYSAANSSRTEMQTAADDSALAVAKEVRKLTSSQIEQKGSDYFNADFHRSNTKITQVKTVYDPAKSTVTVTASGTVKTAFMQLVHVSQMPIGARAVAIAANDGLGCVLSLNPTVSSATSISGTANINLKGCDLYDNSNNTSALTASGSGKLSARYVGVVGGVSGKAAMTTKDGLDTGISPIADPYADTTFPAFSGCDYHNYTVKSDTTLSAPKVFCNGLSVNAGATLTLNPGIYYIDRGSFSVNGGGTVKGTGVTIVFTSSTGSNYATASINGGANINLTAPTSGPTAGIVFFGDRKAPVGTVFKFEGGATQVFGGALYLPKGDVSFAGGADTTTGCTKLIGNTIKFTGDTNFALDCSGLGTKPIGTTLARLLQ